MINPGTVRDFLLTEGICCDIWDTEYNCKYFMGIFVDPI